MTPPAGYRLVTPADREAHPLVPEGALVRIGGVWGPSQKVGDTWALETPYAVPLGLWPERDPAPEPATFQVPADLAVEIHERLSDLATEMEIRNIGSKWKTEIALAERLRLACARLRACPVCGADGARTGRKEAT